MKTFHVKLLYAYKFIGQCLPIYAFYTLLFLERGQSVTDVAILMALWSVFTIIFEVPSGVMADRWNRRNMLVIACLLQSLCFLIWFFSHTILMFAAGFVFWAAASAFTSGTEEGLLYDNLKSDGHEHRFAAVYGTSQFSANIGTVAGLVSAGVLASLVSIGAIALLSAGICFVNAVLAAGLREKNYYSERLVSQSTAFLDTFKEAGAFLKGGGLAFISVLFLVFFAGIGGYLDEYDALIIHDFGLNNIWVSVILTVRFVFIALGDILAPFVQRKISSIRQIFLINGIAFVFLACFAFLWNQYAIIIFGAACMLMAVTKVLLINALQNEIREEGRATVMSFYGIGENMVMIVFSLLYAVLAGIFTLQQVYILIAVYGLIGAAIFYLVTKFMMKKASRR